MRWSGNMLVKKLLRTAWKYKAQFISMIIMVVIGVGIFVGFNVEWYSLYKDTFGYMDDTSYADYRIMSEQGFSEDDLKAIQSIEGVEEAVRMLSINVDYNDTGDKKLGLTVVDNYGEGIHTFYMVEGEDYSEKANGIWLNDKFARENNINVGDSIKISYQTYSVKLNVIGLIKSSEKLICVVDENQLMPDFGSYGYFYMTPASFKAIAGENFYTQINVLSDMDKEDFEEAVDKALGKTTLVLGKDETISYSESEGEMEEGKTMAGILPVLFLLIAALTMVTTMNRITSNEKVQIGTLKALGFKDKKIIWHYTAYGLFIGIVGTVLGTALGYGIGKFIINENGIMATYIDTPFWDLYAPAYTWPVLVVIIGFLTFISFLSVKKMLKGSAADALRPYMPKKVKLTAIEKTKFWSRRSFGTKWNYRDIVRHKSRSAMTLLGVFGCTLLIMAAFGMKDTMKGFMENTYNTTLNYNTQINFNETGDENIKIGEAEKYNADYASSASVKVDGEPITLEIYNIVNDKVRFLGKDGKLAKIQDNGVYICTRLNDKGYDIGDTLEFSPYGSDDTYKVKVAGIIRSTMTENIVMSWNYAVENNIPHTITAAYTDAEPADIEANEAISGTQTKEMVVKALETFTALLNQSVMLLTVAAVILGVVVLYNLGVMSYTERYRELATLKVVGFKDKKISGLLISQNIWLTICGIVIGIPLGVFTLWYMIKALAGEYEMKLVIYPASYIITIAITFAVSFVVGFFISKKNKKINMVEALKNAE